MKKFLLLVCIWVPIGLVISAFFPAVKTAPRLQEEICNWQLVDISEAVAVSDEESMSASISGNTIITSHSIPAGEFCGAQDFTTSHSWTEPFSILSPGDEISFSVEASWSLTGPTDCKFACHGSEHLDRRGRYHHQNRTEKSDCFHRANRCYFKQRLLDSASCLCGR